MDKKTHQEKINHRLTALDTRMVPGEITFDRAVGKVGMTVKELAESRNPATLGQGVRPRQL